MTKYESTATAAEQELTSGANFISARQLGVTPKSQGQKQLRPVVVQDNHKTSESHVERNTTNNSIRYQPLAEAQSMMPIVKWLAGPSGVFAFCASLVKDLHIYILEPGARWYIAKAFAVHLMAACLVGLIVGVGVFLIVWNFTSVGVGRTKIKAESKIKLAEIKAQERIQTARATADAAETRLKVETHEREHRRHMQLLAQQTVNRNQPSQGNLLTTYRQETEIEIDGVHETALLDPVGTKILEFTAQCYEIDPDGNYIYIKPDGYVKKGVVTPWTERGRMTRSETKQAKEVLIWISPRLWRYDRDRKMWQMNLHAYPTLDLALAAINTAPTRKV